VVVTAQYSYGWSFFLAILGFLGAEFSAALCLTAFLNRFDSEVRLKTLGVPRQLKEATHLAEATLSISIFSNYDTQQNQVQH
jgi:hypothetical protein